MSYKLFLDDKRDLHEVTWGNFKEAFGLFDNVVIVKNYEQFVKAIINAGLPSFVSFDHDLGDQAYAAMVRGDFAKATNVEEFQNSLTEKTGYHCAKFLFNYCLDHHVPLPKYHVHSLNPVGRQMILDLLETYNKTFHAFHG